MRTKRFKIKGGGDAVYHCMTRTVNGERLFGNREKEVLRKMLWQVADFSGVEILTYCLMSNHFHVLVRVPEMAKVTDGELLRRYEVLYPKPTQYQPASIGVLKKQLESGGEDATVFRRQLLARMGDVSEFMKALKQRFSVWYNRSHRRFGTLWAERFKSVLVEGRGNALQTMAAYIDMNPVRAGLVEDPKDYRFCGYAEAVADVPAAVDGLRAVWGDFDPDPLRAHRLLIFGKGAGAESMGGGIDRKRALELLEQEEGLLPKATLLRCRVRYFTDGAILGSEAFVRGFADSWQKSRGRMYPPKAHAMKGGEWGGLSVIQGLRRQVFG